MIKRCVLVILFVIISSEGADPPPQSPSISGCWKNEQGSSACFNIYGDGTINGLYYDATGMSKQILEGRQSGGIVSWHVFFESSATTWIGEHFMDCDGGCGPNHSERIIASWVLRREMKTCPFNYLGPIIGQDVFVRDSNLQFSMEKKKSNEN